MDANWIIPTTIGIVVTIPLATLIGYLVYEHAQVRRNRPYKSLRDHTILNAGSHENWAAGVLQPEETQELSRFTTVYAPIVQLATIIALAIMLLISNTSMEDEVTHQRDQIATLETQIQALSFASPGEPSTAVKSDLDPAASILAAQSGAGQAPAPPPSPMQQACANLIGRVADAYEKAESSKVAASLDDLVKRLKCVNGMPP
jgi:hypothetical protein